VTNYFILHHDIIIADETFKSAIIEFRNKYEHKLAIFLFKRYFPDIIENTYEFYIEIKKLCRVHDPILKLSDFINIEDRQISNENCNEELFKIR
jgi:hypothetical protein